jgi:hypothetical protein
VEVVDWHRLASGSDEKTIQDPADISAEQIQFLRRQNIF